MYLSSGNTTDYISTKLKKSILLISKNEPGQKNVLFGLNLPEGGSDCVKMFH